MLSKNQVIDCFDKSAETYDNVADVQALIARELAVYLAKVRANSVLEIGCGTGLLSDYLPRLFPDADLLLTDIAPAMVEKCRQRFTQYDKIKMMCLDGERLSREHTFDLITSSMTLHWFVDFKTSVKKIVKQLNPHGHFIFAALGENSLQEWRAVCHELDVAIGTPFFPSCSEIQRILPGVELCVETYTRRYKNLYVFLTSLKKLGATATRADYFPLSSGKLRNMMRYLKQGVDITYEIIYGKYTAS